MEGKQFYSFKFDWNYDAGYVDIKTTNDVSDALYSFQHTPPSQPQYSPHDHNPIRYRKKHHHSKGPDLSKNVNKKETKDVQSVVGAFLYYARAIDSTMLPSLNEISGKKPQPTQETMKKSKQLMDFVATYPNSYILIHASDMILMIDTYSANLVMPKAQSLLAG